MPLLHLLLLLPLVLMLVLLLCVLRTVLALGGCLCKTQALISGLTDQSQARQQLAAGARGLS
jgi:hypothetical protein